MSYFFLNHPDFLCKEKRKKSNGNKIESCFPSFHHIFWSRGVGIGVRERLIKSWYPAYIFFYQVKHASIHFTFLVPSSLFIPPPKRPLPINFIFMSLFSPRLHRFRSSYPFRKGSTHDLAVLVLIFPIFCTESILVSFRNSIVLVVKFTCPSFFGPSFEIDNISNTDLANYSKLEAKVEQLTQLMSTIINRIPPS